MKTEESSNKPILVSDLLEKELELLKEKDERIFYTHDIGIKVRICEEI